MKYQIGFIIFFLISCNMSKHTFNKIDNVLGGQTTSWNRGDIPNFMEGYIKNDSLSFMGSNGVTYGWVHVKNNYLKGYPTQDIMGQLKFTIIERKMLSRNSAYYLGKYELKKEEEAFGYFTLIWKKKDGKWKIIHDHTSAGN